MSGLGTCRWCGVGELFGPVFLYPETGMGGGEVLVAAPAGHRLLEKVVQVTLQVHACRSCGHLELFAADPGRLHERWSEKQG